MHSSTKLIISYTPYNELPGILNIGTSSSLLKTALGSSSTKHPISKCDYWCLGSSNPCCIMLSIHLILSN